MTAVGPRDDVDRLLATCEVLLTRDDWAVSHWWARGAAHLSRQAIEQLLDHYWEVRSPPMTRVSQRAKFLGLQAFMDDEGLAREGYVTWRQLSRACHYHAYDLAPTTAELHGWLLSTRRFCDGLRLAATAGD